MRQACCSGEPLPSASNENVNVWATPRSLASATSSRSVSIAASSGGDASPLRASVSAWAVVNPSARLACRMVSASGRPPTHCTRARQSSSISHRRSTGGRVRSDSPLARDSAPTATCSCTPSRPARRVVMSTPVTSRAGHHVRGCTGCLPAASGTPSTIQSSVSGAVCCSSRSRSASPSIDRALA